MSWLVKSLNLKLDIDHKVLISATLNYVRYFLYESSRNANKSSLEQSEFRIPSYIGGSLILMFGIFRSKNAASWNYLVIYNTFPCFNKISKRSSYFYNLKYISTPN